MARNTIEIVINADDNASKKINGVKGALSGLSSIGATAGKLAAGAVAGIGVAAAGAAAGIGKLAAQAAPVEGIAAAFAATADNADDMLASLEEGSAGMISQRDLMRSFNEAAQLVSKDFAQRLPSAMESLRKVSASTGKDMGFLLDSLSTGVGRMSPLILDNLGIQVSLAEATEKASEMFGVQADELSETQKQAGMTEIVMAALAENTADLPDVSGSAAAGMAQLGAMFQDVKDRIGRAFLPVLERILSGLLSIADRVLPVVLPAIERFANKLLLLAEPMGQFLNAIMNGQPLLQALGTALRQAFGEDIAEKIMPIITKIIEFGQAIGQFVQEHKPAIIAALKAIGAAIAAASIASAIASIAAAIAAIANPVTLVVAAIAVLAAAWTEDWGGIRTWMTEFWNSTLQPIFQQVVTWLGENIPIAIQKVTDFWTNTLQPALQTIWQFLKENILPIIKTLAEIYIKLVITYFRAWAGVIQNVIIPALKKIWDAMKDVASFAAEKLGPAIKWLNDKVFGPLGEKLGSIKGFFESILSLLEKFKAKLDNLELPPWLTPGSPTPFELGLRGIAAAMQDLNRIDMPTFGGGQQTTNNTTNSYGVTVPVNIQGNADADTMREATEQGVLVALRANGAI